MRLAGDVVGRMRQCGSTNYLMLKAAAWLHPTRNYLIGLDQGLGRHTQHHPDKTDETGVKSHTPGSCFGNRSTVQMTEYVQIGPTDQT